MVKHIETICRLLATNCLSVFDHFVGLVFKGLTLSPQLLRGSLWIVTYRWAFSLDNEIAKHGFQWIRLQASLNSSIPQINNRIILIIVYA